MASTFTPNIQWEEPARGDDVGTWDTPVNSNGTLIDRVVGAIATIPLNNSNVVLSNAQFQSKQITFNSTLTGSVTITFPTSFTKSYEIQNLCTGSSAFTITLQTTSAGALAIGCPAGETFDCFNDGANMKFKNFGRVGTLWDYAGSSIPNWVSACSQLPWLNCDGTTFSSASYPALAVILGGNTLPDIRGTTRYALNQGTGRLTTASGGLDGNTNFSVKTTPTVTIASSNLPTFNISVVSNSANIVTTVNGFSNIGAGGGAVLGCFLSAAGQAQGAQTSSGTFTGANNPLPAIGTGTVAGITMIRAG
jgi:microcystin-dependent protein